MTAHTYTAHFEEVARRFPDRIAFRLKTPGGYTHMRYGEVHGQVLGIARGLVSMGLKPGTRVKVYLATARAGGTNLASVAAIVTAGPDGKALATMG